MPVKMMSRVLTLSIGIALLFGQAPRPSEADGTPAKPKGKTNRLARETSPYLLMHAQNPVDWYPWGPEAFEKARKEGKLVFLSIGYSSCYWCHVMERKVFMNEQIAKSMNDNFVCIKVDREERPDIDDVYMTALTVYFQLTGSPAGGGWPLSMFLTPDGNPVAGGTYFPPEDTNGAHGFPTVMERLSDLWKNKREKLEENSQIISDATRRAMRPKLGLQETEVNDALVGKAFEAVVSSIDPVFGGVDFNPQRPNGPKFPTPAKLLFLQEHLKNHPDPEAADLLDVTLMQIACGGIRDHIGGGFHRYSVDRKWYVPHFEKMLYDQAQLVDVFVNAYVDSKNKFFKQVAEEALLFVEREITSADGGFYSALDAETNGVEGEFYVWDSRDIDRVLGDKAQQFKDAYHVKDLPDFEYGNVLRLSSDQLPQAMRSGQVIGANADFETDEFSAMRQKLLMVRNQRPKVMRDEKILSGWNGLMIGAFARAGMRLGQPQFLKTAEKAGTFLMTNLRDAQGRLLHTYTSGQAKLNAYLDDYAYVIDGLLALHEATRDPRWLKAAKQFQDDQLKMFRDDAGGGFYFTSHQHEELLARTKNCYDGVQPAGNSVSARNLLKLARLTSDKRYRDEARTVIELFASNLDQNPRGSSILALAMSELLASEQPDQQSSGPSTNVIVAVAADDSKVKSEPLVVLADQKEETPKKEETIKAKAYLSVDRLPAGNACQLIVLIDVKKGWHINANPPQPDNLKPTKITWKSKNGITLAEVKYPKGKPFKFTGDDEEAMVYEGEVQIRTTVKIPKEAAGRTEEVEIAVEYQACNENGCLAPKTIKLTGKLPVAKEGDPVRPVNAKLFGAKTDASR